MARTALSRFRRRTTTQRRTGPSPALVQARNQLAAMRRRGAAMRRNAGGKTGPVKAVAYTGAGGIASGLLQAFAPDIMGIDTRWIGAGAAVGTGIFVLKKGELSTALINAGGGMLACAIEDVTVNAVAGMMGEPEEVPE